MTDGLIQWLPYSHGSATCLFPLQAPAGALHHRHCQLSPIANFRWSASLDLGPCSNAVQSTTAGRAGAVGKRSRMRPGLPEFYNANLERPTHDTAGFDIIHIDVSSRNVHVRSMSRTVLAVDAPRAVGQATTKYWIA